MCSPTKTAGSDSVGLAPGASPLAVANGQGVSVRYARDERKRWFVVRATYGRALKARDELLAMGAQGVYCPSHKVVKEVVEGGKARRRRVEEAYLPSLLFVYDTPRQVADYVKGDRRVECLSFYYNHFKEVGDGLNPPLTVSYADMENFIRLMDTGDEHIRIVSEGQCRFKGGDKVRVVAGEFKGIVGEVARIARQQRVVVKLPGVCWVATAYIPTAFMQPA